jgi:hypothetical protein
MVTVSSETERAYTVLHDNLHIFMTFPSCLYMSRRDSPLPHLLHEFLLRLPTTLILASSIPSRHQILKLGHEGLSVQRVQTIKMPPDREEIIQVESVAPQPTGSTTLGMSIQRLQRQLTSTAL